jgi:outer membrane immunogenic protein
MLRKLLMSTVVLFGATAVASAADLPTTKGAPIYTPPPPPIFTWTGLYIGVQAGYEFGHSSTVAAGAGLPGYNPSGIDGGAHIGYNYQIGQFVAGLETDVNGSNYRGSNTFGALGYNTTDDIDGSVRGRLGVAWDRALIYATGGAAFGNFRNQYAAGPALDTLWNTRVGWTVGGGVEYALDNNWSLRAEYRYTDYPGFNEFAPTTVGGNVYKHETDNKVQLGVSYKFDLMGPASVVSKY